MKRSSSEHGDQSESGGNRVGGESESTTFFWGSFICAFSRAHLLVENHRWAKCVAARLIVVVVELTLLLVLWVEQILLVICSDLGMDVWLGAVGLIVW